MPLRFEISLAGSVQPVAKPWSCSASSIRGVTICRSMSPPGFQIAGGDGMPMVEPPFRVGTASLAQPSPRVPSVQERARSLFEHPEASELMDQAFAIIDGITLPGLAP